MLARFQKLAAGTTPIISAVPQLVYSTFNSQEINNTTRPWGALTFEPGYSTDTEEALLAKFGLNPTQGGFQNKNAGLTAFGVTLLGSYQPSADYNSAFAIGLSSDITVELISMDILTGGNNFVGPDHGVNASASGRIFLGENEEFFPCAGNYNDHVFFGGLIIITE